MSVIRYVEIFGGVGGFRVGLDRANRPAYEQIGNIDTTRRGSSSETGSEPQLSGSGGVGLDSQPGAGDSEGRTEPQLEGSGGRIQQEFRCVGYIELDPECDRCKTPTANVPDGRYRTKCSTCGKTKSQPQVKVYNERFGESYEPTDARGVDPQSLPDFDMLVGGFPCQSFSIAGKRKGFDDTRGTLFFEVARIAKARHPRLLLLENVKGLLNHEEGETFRTILATLDELGYDAEWEVLNSKHFGVPQNRERVFIVGHLRSQSWREIFPLGQGRAILVATSSEERSGNQTARTLSSPGHSGGNHTDMNLVIERLDDNESIEHRLYDPEGIAPSLPTGATGGNLIPKIINATNAHNSEETRQFHESDAARALKTGWSQQESKVVDFYNQSVSDEVGTLSEGQAHRGNAGFGILGSRIRRLTPTECERLQSFDDGWTEGASDTARYKMMGNAVTTTVIEAIGRRILEVEGP